MSKQVADQNEEIKTLKRDLLDTDTNSRELKYLQNQIDSLVKSNNEKEKAIRTEEEELLMEVEENDDVGDGIQAISNSKIRKKKFKP